MQDGYTKVRTEYEWDIETVDAEMLAEGSTDPDIEGHEESDKCPSRVLASNERLVLVRHTGSDAEGVLDRFWAYVKDGKLPECFEDCGRPTQIKVPQRFHAELAKVRG